MAGQDYLSKLYLPLHKDGFDKEFVSEQLEENLDEARKGEIGFNDVLDNKIHGLRKLLISCPGVN